MSREKNKIPLVDYSDIWTRFRDILSTYHENVSAGTPSKFNEESALEQQLQLYDMWVTIVSDYENPFTVQRGKRRGGGDGDGDGDGDGGGSEELVNMVGDASSRGKLSDSMRSGLLYRITQTCGRTEVVNLLTGSFERLGDWSELPKNLGLKHSWNLLWTWRKPRVDHSSLLSWQRINHIPGAKHLTRKDMLKNHIHR